MEPKLLWRPPADRAEHATIARFARAVGREGDYDELWRWSVDDLEALLGRDLGVLRRAGLRAVRARPRAARDARRAVVPGVAAVLRRALLPRSRRRRGGHPPRQRAARAVAVDVGRAARADRAHRRRAAAHGRRSRRSRGRLHAEHPRDGRGLPGHRLDRRGVVERRARVRRALGGRPLRADRAQGAPGRRRLPLRRARPRPQRDRGRHRRGDRREGRALRLPRRRWVAGGARGPRRPADLRAGAVRPPALAALQLGHHGPAQADRRTARAGSCSST